MLSPDGRLLATWYRPDYWLVLPVGPDQQQTEWSELYADWTSRLDTLPAEIRVVDLDGVGLFSLQVDAHTRLADFDGRFLVVAGGVPWTIIDTAGQQADLTVTGPVALLTGGVTPG